MRQYERIKAQFPDAILFFRLGDFYEMFGEDAVTASKVLGIALTSRNKGPDAVPLAGVPHHSAESYLARLIKAGYKVAVCEQVEDPAQAKGVVKREVVRVITPGTVYEENIVPKGENVYLAAVHRRGDDCSIAFCDLSTGEFAADTLRLARLGAELNRLSARELLLPSDDAGLAELVRAEYASFNDCAVETVPPPPDPAEAAQRLRDLFDELPEDFEGRGWLPAAAMLVAYLDETQRGNLGQFRVLKDNALTGALAVDARSLRNLEVVQSFSGKRSATLLGVCDYTSTPMGKRMLRRWLTRPLTDVQAIRRRQEAVRVLLDRHDLRSRIAELVAGMSDLERITARAAANRASPRDLAALRDTLGLVAELVSALADAPEPLSSIAASLDPMPSLRELLARTLTDSPPAQVGGGELIREGVDEELDSLRAVRSGARNWIAEYQREESRRTGIASLKIGYNQVFGYYIEVTRPNLHLVPDNYIRKQTLANAERFITPELKEQETRVLNAAERIEQIEWRIFREIRAGTAGRARELYALAAALAELDVLRSFAELAEQRRYVIPEVNDGLEIRIREGRHPVVEANMPPGEFVPNDTELGPDSLIHIITGPNMAGKSTYIRQVAQIVLLAQAGAPVPASEAVIGVADRLLTRIGAGDDLARGRSTFMVEMLETAEILATATPRSLVVLDEVGRGTSTFDGLSLAWAITEYIHDTRSCNARTLFATHYHELTELAALKSRVKNFNVAVREWKDKVIFLHRIEPGFTDRSYGIHVARLAGMPEKVIERAAEILRTLEKQALDVEGKPRRGVLRNRKRPREVQLLLFESPYEYLLDEIRELDLERMTPLEAFRFLQKLKEELES